MEVIKTDIEGLVIIKPKVFGDERGYFLESFNLDWFRENIQKDISFVQDNESKSSKGVLRGLHFQKPPFKQAKLVRVIEGSVIDVAVDLRKDSTTYGKSFAIELTAENKLQLFVPRGFAHGFFVNSETAIFSYKVDNNYAPEFEDGIIWKEKDLNIDWQIMNETILLSEKDKTLQQFSQFKSPF